MKAVKDYLIARAKERDTQVVVAAALYSIARSFIPPQYTVLADSIASLFGIGVAATPLKKGE